MKVLSLCIILALISFSAGACDTTTGPEEPDIPDAPFVWRVCNEHDQFSMYDIHVQPNHKLIAEKLSPNECTEYLTASGSGHVPISALAYEINEDDYSIIYLESFLATKGLIDKDSLTIQDVPGRYSYRCNYDSSRRYPIWVEIEREAYH